MTLWWRSIFSSLCDLPSLAPSLQRASSAACVTCPHWLRPCSHLPPQQATLSHHLFSLPRYRQIHTPNLHGVSIFKTLSFPPSHLILTSIPWSWQVRSNPCLTLVRNRKQVTSQPASSAFLHITRKAKRLGQQHAAWKRQDQEET